MPDTTHRVVRWLEAAPERLEVWKASAAWAGAQMALGFVKSWYPSMEMDQLATRRAEVDLALHSEVMTTHATALASYANLDEFVKDRAKDGTELPEDNLGLALNGEEDIEEETDSSSEGDRSETPADEEDDADSAGPETADPDVDPATAAAPGTD